jgi:predicted GH43/DUF377 family glycosyl hydrolase
MEVAGRMTGQEQKPKATVEEWELGPFSVGEVVLGADLGLTFDCPLAGSRVAWAAKDVFNPGAVVREGLVHLLVRAEDNDGPSAGTSRLGLATSDDGVHFTLRGAPVLYPDQDPWQALEWPGGLEDPRLVESPEGGYVCTYSGFDGRRSHLMIATSEDLVQWEKHGPAFAGTPYADRWTKSAAIVTEVKDGRLVAVRVNGRYQMYWGEGWCYGASSDDLIHWDPLEFDAFVDRHLTRSEDDTSWEIHRQTGDPTLRPLLAPRRGRFDSLLVEPGPPALLTDAGITLIYNGARLRHDGGEVIGVSYAPGQVLFDAKEPGSVLERNSEAMLVVTPADLQGQVDQVCFAEGLVLFGDYWFLYFGMGDSRIGVATAPARGSTGN